MSFQSLVTITIKIKTLKKVLILIAGLSCIAALLFSIRGLAGNPDIIELNAPKWTEDGPFELSPERGRFALMYSVVVNKSLQFPVDVARFALPDLGYKNEKYVSLFAPALSFLIIPGYIVGKFLGFSQVGTFAVISIFAILNLILIGAISRQLGAHPLAGLIAGMVFLFGTPAYTYSITLYQHHVSTFAILLSIYALLRWKDFRALLAVMFLYPLAIAVDYPNFFLMLPIGIFSISYVIFLKQIGNRVLINLKPYYLLTLAASILPITFFLWFNKVSYNNPFQLAGSVSQVKDIDQYGLPTAPKDFDPTAIGITSNTVDKNRSAVGYFYTRAMLNGFYILLFSPDRGVVTYAPVILLGLMGIYILYKNKNPYLTLLISISAMNLILYSMWGDPWGGWAFGARYLIPAYSIMAIFLAVALTKLKKNIFFILLLLVLFLYSVRVNTLGAITTSRMPPKVEVLDLEQRSHQVQKYTYERNLDLLKQNYVKSFVYENYLSKTVTGVQYFWIVYIFIVTGFVITTGCFVFFKEKQV